MTQNIGTLVNKFIVDSGVPEKYAEIIRDHLASGLERAYQHISQKGVYYAMPVKIVGFDENSYAVQWVAPYQATPYRRIGGGGGIAMLVHFYIHNVKDDTIKMEGAKVLLPHPVSFGEREFNSYTFDELTKMLERAGYDTRRISAFRSRFTPEQLEIKFYEEEVANSILIQEQIRNVIELCSLAIQTPKFKEVKPEQYMIDLIADLAGRMDASLRIFERMRKR